MLTLQEALHEGSLVNRQASLSTTKLIHVPSGPVPARRKQDPPNLKELVLGAVRSLGLLALRVQLGWCPTQGDLPPYLMLLLDWTPVWQSGLSKEISVQRARERERTCERIPTVISINVPGFW